MLKKTIAAITLCLLTSTALAQSFKVQREMICDTIDNILAELKKFDEQPVWQGKNSQGLIAVLLTNKKTKSWSYIITDNQRACLVDSGDGYMLLEHNTQK
jgi:hypothetical protein